MRKFNATKSKKILAVLLSVIVGLGGVVCVSGLIDGKSELDETPLLFNAGYDYVNRESAEFVSGDNYKQIGPIWYYEFSKSDTELTWLHLDRNDGSTWCPASGHGIGRETGIRDTCRMTVQNYASKNKNGAVAYKFVVPKSGYIDIQSSNIRVLSSSSSNYNANIRITKNNENVYPQSDYTTVNFVPDDPETTDVNEHNADNGHTIKNLKFAVKEGDVIRFEMRPDKVFTTGGDSITVSWNPTFYLRPYKNAYVGNGIMSGLTRFMRGVFSEIESANFDDYVPSKEEVAIEATKTAVNGVYSPLSAVYGEGDLVKSTNESVWKFGVQTAFSPQIESKTNDFSFFADKVTDGVMITPQTNEYGSLFTVVAVDDSGNSYSYVGTKGSVTIPTSDLKLPYKVQIKFGTRASEVSYLVENGKEIEKLIKDDNLMLQDTLSQNEGKGNANVKVYNQNADSYYRFYYSKLDTQNSVPRPRSIKFNAVKGEKMRFGFTAPYAGQYEISAPITVNGSETYYSVWVEAKTSRTLTPLTKYTAGDNFCESQLYLAKGDTVWFEAYTLGESIIDMGIPKITAKKQEGESPTTYRYTATDYVENKTANGYTDYAAVSSTETVQNAWVFGNYDAAAESLQLKPYSLIRDGFYYITSVDADKNSVGSLYPTFDDNSSDTEKPIYMRNKFYGTVDANTGIYMKFTAPIGMGGKLNLTDGESGVQNVKLTIMKNSEVFKVYENGINAGESVDLGLLNPGDTVTLLYQSADADKAFGYLGSPVMELTGKIIPVTFKSQENAPLYFTMAVKNNQLVMPQVQQYSGISFLGWYDQNGNSLKVGEVADVKDDSQFVTKYAYYGDINCDNVIDEADSDGIRAILLEKESDVNNTADIKTDGQVNIADYLRITKLLVNNEYNCN